MTKKNPTVIIPQSMLLADTGITYSFPAGRSALEDFLFICEFNEELLKKYPSMKNSVPEERIEQNRMYLQLAKEALYR